VHNLGMKLQSEELAILVRNRGEGTTLGFSDRHETLGHRLDDIPVTHPNVIRLARFKTTEQWARIGEGHVGPAIFVGLGTNHFTAQQMAHQLHPVADPEYGQTELKDAGIYAG
jgi:hypothetical protein